MNQAQEIYSETGICFDSRHKFVLSHGLTFTVKTDCLHILNKPTTHTEIIIKMNAVKM